MTTSCILEFPPHNMKHGYDELHNHYLIYGNNDVANYGYILDQLKKKSPSALKYSRKTTIDCGSQELTFPVSDIHVEVDFELLGVNEYNVFFELFRHISENLVLNSQSKHLFVLCLHFDKIKKELMDVFYNFLNHTKITFIFLTNHLCYVHPHILKRAKIKKHKCVRVDPSLCYSNRYQPRIRDMVQQIVGKNKWSFFQWREKLYELLILNYSIHDCFSYFIECLVEEEYLNDENMDSFFVHYMDIMEKYNNNYRTIYHLERFIVFLRNLKKNPQE